MFHLKVYNGVSPPESMLLSLNPTCHVHMHGGRSAVRRIQAKQAGRYGNNGNNNNNNIQQNCVTVANAMPPKHRINGEGLPRARTQNTTTTTPAPAYHTNNVCLGRITNLLGKSNCWVIPGSRTTHQRPAQHCLSVPVVHWEFPV